MLAQPDNALPWTDPPEYLAAVEAYIAPLRGGPFWEGLRQAYTDLSRFRDFAGLMATYTPLAGKRLLDSGCGSAGLALTLHLAGAAEVVGIEFEILHVQARDSALRLSEQILVVCRRPA